MQNSSHVFPPHADFCRVMHPSLPPRRPRASRRTSVGLTFLHFFRCFSACKKTHDFRLLKKLLFLAILAIFCASGVEFRRFWVPKRLPGGYFFGVFSKTVIFSKSCSRCGGNLIFKGQTLRKSVPRATPNDNGARKREKSVPAPSPDALFRPRARFWSILASWPGPKIA